MQVLYHKLQPTSALSNECKEMPIMNAQYKKRHDYVVSQLNKINGVECRETDGTFYVFPSFRKYMNSVMTLQMIQNLHCIF